MPNKKTSYEECLSSGRTRGSDSLLKIAISLLASFAVPPLFALAPGDAMFLGYESRTSPTDDVSFVTWVEIADGESLTIADADYTTGGDGSGEGINGGGYSSVSTITWTNNTGAPLPAGTVISITDVKVAVSANVGTATGSFSLTKNGEQLFIVDGTFEPLTSNTDYLDGNLIYGLDYEGNVGWGESGESDLPGALNVPLGNLSLGLIEAASFFGATFGDSVAEL